MLYRMKNSNGAWIFVCQLCYISNTQVKLQSFTQLTGDCVVCDKQFYGAAPTWV
jgi:hypothetical protein